MLIREQSERGTARIENWVFFFHQNETIFEIYEVSNEYWGKIILNKLADFVKNVTNNLGISILSHC